MPRMKNRARTLTGAGELTEDQLDYLISGWCLDSVVGGGYADGMPFEDIDAAKAVWKVHRTLIIEQSRAEAKDRYRDGSRRPVQFIPWAFWRFEATEGLRQLSGPKPLEPVELSNGTPRMWKTYEEWKAAEFESESDYCSRLGISPKTLRVAK